MTRMTARDFDPEVLKLFDQYVHGRISRRGFLASAGKYAVGGMTAAGLLSALSPSFAAQMVASDDPRIATRLVEYPSPQGYGAMRGYLAAPAHATDKLPAVLVVHENRGLNPHIEDIVRRLALANFIAFAPDALFPLGGYPGDEDKARELFAKLDQGKTRADFIAAAGLLKTLPGTNGKVGVIGFCFGGGMANYLATRLPDLDAAVAFYGNQPSAAEAAKIKAPLQLHDAEKDERIGAGRPAFEAALNTANVRYQSYVYPGTEHGFNTDTTPRYDEVAAKLAWQRSLGFLHAHLG